MTRPNRIHFFAFTLVILFVLSVPSSRVHAAPETVTLQLKWYHQFQFAGFYAALEKGFYREAGLDVVIKEGIPGGQDIMDILLSGQADYLVSHPGVLIDRANGKPVVALASIFQHSPLVLSTANKSEIVYPSDLAGRSVMLSPKRDPEIISMLRKEGIAVADLNVVRHSWNLADLKSGRVDAMATYLTDAPIIAEQLGFKLNIIHPANYGVDFYGDILYTTENEIHHNSDRVNSFRDASLKGWSYALEHPEEIIDLLIEKYQCRLSREALIYEAKVTYELIRPDSVEVGHMNPGRWRYIADTFISAGLLQPDFSLSGFLYEPDHARLVTREQLRFVFICIWGGAFTGIILLAFNMRLRYLVRRKTEEVQTSLDKVKTSEEMFRLLLESTSESVYGVDHEGRATFCNPSCVKALGYNSQKDLLGLNMHEKIHHKYPDGREMKEADCKIYMAIYRGKSVYVDDEVLWRKDGTSFAVEYWSSPIIKDGQTLGAVVFFSDITRRLEIEKELVEKEKMLLQAQKIGHVGSWRHDFSTGQMQCSEESYSIFGVPPDDIMTYTEFLEYVYPDDRSFVVDVYMESIKGGSDDYNCEYRILVGKKTGRLRYVVARSKHFRNEKGDVVFSVGTVQDITESKVQEQRLMELLEQKNTLLKEVHHRVKNNMQIVAGLMQLHLADEKDSTHKNKIGEMIDRVHTMALLHESIYKSSDFSKVNAELYIAEIVEHMTMSHLSSDSLIVINTNIESIELDVDVLVPIGLAINELLLNSLKHAFRDMQKGAIDVSLSHIGGTVQLQVRDNGCGVRSDFNFEKTQTLGFRLIHALADQLTGTISIRNDAGLDVTITFPVRN